MLSGEELAEPLRQTLGADRIENIRRLSGGASREMWSFDAVTGETSRPLVLCRYVRRGAAGPITPRIERALLEAAATAGVPVPRVVTGAEDGSELGAPYLISERIDGETIPRRILRDEAFGVARGALAAQCGQALARLHSIPVDAISGLADTDQIEQFRAILDGFDEPHPAFEIAFRWLEQRRPATTGKAIVHGDFRHGNLIVGPDGLRAVLDWELAHAGDPMEDLGWLCVKAWRFGSSLPVGGFGEYEELFRAYESEGGRAVDPSVVHWWEVLGTLKWGVMCMVQAYTHLSGAVRSVELAAIGRRVAENEWDLLGLIAPADSAAPSGPSDPGPATAPPPSFHGRPTAAELLDAVGEFLEGDVMGATEGRVQFHARVATNVVRMVERELALGPAQADAHRKALARLGVADERELAAGIKDGRFEDRQQEVVDVVRQTARAKLEVANPKYLLS